MLVPIEVNFPRVPLGPQGVYLTTLLSLLVFGLVVLREYLSEEKLSWPPTVLLSILLFPAALIYGGLLSEFTGMALNTIAVHCTALFANATIAYFLFRRGEGPYF